MVKKKNNLPLSVTLEEDQRVSRLARYNIRTQSKQCSTKATKTAVQRARNAKPVDKKKRGRPVKYHSVEERKEAAKVAAKKHLDKKIALKRKELGLSEFVWKICNPISTVVKHSEPGPKGLSRDDSDSDIFKQLFFGENNSLLAHITQLTNDKIARYNSKLQSSSLKRIRSSSTKQNHEHLDCRKKTLSKSFVVRENNSTLNTPKTRNKKHLRKQSVRTLPGVNLFTMQVFFSLLLRMKSDQKIALSEYWVGAGKEWYAQRMGYRRFLGVCRMVTVDVNHVIESLGRNFRSHWKSTGTVVMDESFSTFRGFSPHFCKISSKGEHAIGTKIITSCDSCSPPYMLTLRISKRNDEKKTKKRWAQIVDAVGGTEEEKKQLLDNLKSSYKTRIAKKLELARERMTERQKKTHSALTQTGLLTKVFLNLFEDLADMGDSSFHVITDRWFTCEESLQCVLKHNHHFTVHSKKKNFTSLWKQFGERDVDLLHAKWSHASEDEEVAHPVQIRNNTNQFVSALRSDSHLLMSSVHRDAENINSCYKTMKGKVDVFNKMAGQLRWKHRNKWWTKNMLFTLLDYAVVNTRTIVHHMKDKYKPTVRKVARSIAEGLAPHFEPMEHPVVQCSDWGVSGPSKHSCKQCASRTCTTFCFGCYHSNQHGLVYVHEDSTEISVSKSGRNLIKKHTVDVMKCNSAYHRARLVQTLDEEILAAEENLNRLRNKRKMLDSE